MRKFITLAIFIWYFLCVSTTAADKMPQETPQSAISDLIAINSVFYHVPQSKLDSVIKCESGYNPKAHNPNPPLENSWGLVQINLLAHHDISVKQATDPSFAIDYLAKNLAMNTDHWTCK